MSSPNRACLQNGNAEDKVDQDFLLYLSHAKWCLMELPEKLRDRAGAWIRYLISRNPRTVPKKKIRNMHLSTLLLDMTFGQLKGVYAEKPPNPDEPLPPLRAAVLQETSGAPVAGTPCPEKVKIQPPDWVQKLIEGNEQASENKDHEMSHASKDGRLYVATKALPDHSGAYGFLAMSMEKKEGIVDGMGDMSALINEKIGVEEVERGQDACCGEINSNQWQQGDTDAAQKMAAELLAWRRPPDAREAVDRIYQNLMALVERAMKGEKSARVEMLLEQMEEDMKTDSTYDLLWELPRSAKREELLKRLLDLIVLKRGQLVRREKFLRRMEEIVPPVCKGFAPEQPCFNLSSNLSAPTEPQDFCENQTESRSHSAKARNVDELLARAIEHLQFESNVEFCQKLAAVREELQLDLSSAKAEHQRAKSSYETALKALNQAREELEKVTENPGRLDALVNQLEMLQAQHISYSEIISEELQNLCETKRQVRDIRGFRQRELEDLRETYADVRVKLRQAEETSDINSDACSGKRKRKRARKFSSSSDSECEICSDDAQEDMRENLPKFPSPPPSVMHRTTPRRPSPVFEADMPSKSQSMEDTPKISDLSNFDGDFKKHVMRQLSRLRSMVALNTELLESVSKQLTNIKGQQDKGSSEIAVPSPPAENFLNISTEDELLTMEEQLKNESFADKMVVYLRQIGRNTASDDTRRIMRRVINDEMAAEFSLAGAGSK